MLQCAIVRNSDSAAAESGQLNTPNGALLALHTLCLQINIVCSVHCYKFDLIYKKIFIIFISLNKFI
jgi:hypothetical protein